MSYDRVSEKLLQVAPMVDPDFLEAVRRHEDRSLVQLQEERAAVEERFRAWVRDPANAGRPLQEAEGYHDRLALDSLLERRMWWE